MALEERKEVAPPSPDKFASDRVVMLTEHNWHTHTLPLVPLHSTQESEAGGQPLRVRLVLKAHTEGQSQQEAVPHHRHRVEVPEPSDTGRQRVIYTDFSTHVSESQ